MMGANNQFNAATPAPVTLAGGTLNAGGFSQGAAATVGIGALTLTSTSVINLLNTSVLHFADSSGAAWTASQILRIDNWSGSPTGGGTEQLIFGSTSTGLSTTQLGQIQFLDPAGFAAGTYGATILSTGEVVPVPEPSTWIAGALALGAVAFTQRRSLTRLLNYVG